MFKKHSYIFAIIILFISPNAFADDISSVIKLPEPNKNHTVKNNDANFQPWTVQDYVRLNAIPRKNDVIINNNATARPLRTIQDYVNLHNNKIRNAM
ncbi:MAG: hypothetical protein WD572_12010 [Gammaproteobacteria bacterium]